LIDSSQGKNNARLHALAYGHLANEGRLKSQMKSETQFVLVNSDPGVNCSPTHEEISGLAHQIYQAEGCPDGRADEHWFAAKGFLDRESCKRNATMSHDATCQEISGELEDMAKWLSGRNLSLDQFRLDLTKLEAQKLERFGMKLSSLISEHRVVRFILRFSDTDELCASMDVDPITGKICTKLACG